MQEIHWDLALARVEFVREYTVKMRKGVAMKNEKTQASAPTTQVPPRQPWPAHRRFWHRNPAPPVKPSVPSSRPRSNT